MDVHGGANPMSPTTSSPRIGPGPVSEGFGGRTKTKGNDDDGFETQVDDLKKELAQLHEMRGSRVHSPEVLAYFATLRSEKDTIARKALAEKRKLEAEVVELRRKCSTMESSLDAERDVTRKVKAREADAQLNAEREAAARSQTADQRDEADRQLRSLHEQRERESISVGELDERVAQLAMDVQLERERAERAEEDLRAMRATSGEAEMGEEEAAARATRTPSRFQERAPLPGAGQTGGRSSTALLAATNVTAGVCGGLWRQKRHIREGWDKLLDEATARFIPHVVIEQEVPTPGASSSDVTTNQEEDTPPWIHAVLSGDFGAAAAAARGSGAVTIYVTGANADTKSERGIILEDVQPYLRRLARAVGLDLAIVDLASGGEGTPLNPRAIDMVRRDVHAGRSAVSASGRHDPVGTLGGGMLVLLLGDMYGATVLPHLLPGEEFEAVVDNMTRHERRNRGEGEAAMVAPDDKTIVPSIVFREMYESDALSSEVGGNVSGNDGEQSKSTPTSMMLRLKPPSMPSSDLDEEPSESYLKGRASLARWRKGLSLAALAARKAAKRLVVKGKLPLHALERYTAASTEAAAAAAILGRLPGDTSTIQTVKKVAAESDSADLGIGVDGDDTVHVDSTSEGKMRSTSAVFAPSASATWRADLASAPAVRSVMMVDRTTEGINMTDVAARSHCDVAVDPASGTHLLDSDGAYVTDNSAQRSLTSLKGALGAFLPKNQRFESNPKWVSDGITVASSGTYLAKMADAVCSMLAERIMEGGIVGSGVLEEVAREAAAHGAAAAALKTAAEKSLSPEQAFAINRIIRYVRGAEGGGPVVVPLVIRASPGGGMSTALANGLAADSGLTTAVVPLLRIVGLTTASSGAHSLITGICDHLAVLAGKPEKSPGLAATLQSLPMSRVHELQPLLSNLLGAAARTLAAAGRGPLVLAIDGVHRLSGGRSSRSLTWLPCSLPPNIRVIITLSDDPTDAADALRTFPTRMTAALLSMSLSATRPLGGPATESFTDRGGATTSSTGAVATVDDDKVKKAMAMSAAAAFMKGGAGIVANAEESNLAPPEPVLPPPTSEPAVHDSSNESSDDNSESDRDEDEGESDDELTIVDVPIPLQCIHVIAHSNWKMAAHAWTSNAADDEGKMSPLSDVTVKAIDAAIDAFPSCTPARARLAAAAARRGLLNPIERAGVKRKAVPSGSAVELVNELLKAAEETHGELLTRRALRLLTAAEHGLSLSELGDLMASDDDIIRNLQAVDAGQTFALPQPLLRSLRRHLTGFVVERTGGTGISEDTELMLAPFQPSLRRAPTLFISLLLNDLNPLLLRLSPSDGAALLSWRSEDEISAARARYLSTVEDQRAAFTELVNYFSASGDSNHSGSNRASGVAGLRPLRLQAPDGQYHRVVDDSIVAPQPVAHHADSLKGGCICASGPTRPGLKPDANLNRRKLVELPAAILGLIDTGGVRATSKAENVLCDFDLVAGMLATGSGDRLREVFAAATDACKRSGRDPRSLIELTEFVRMEADFLAQHPGSTLQQALNCPFVSVSTAAAKVEAAVATRAAGGMCSQAIMFHWRNKPVARPTGGLVWRAHKGIIRAIAYSPDGLRLATAGEDGAVTIHDAITCEPESLTKGHEPGHKAIAVAWSPSGRRLVSGGDDCFVRVWDPSTGDSLRALDASFSVQAVSFAQTSNTSETPGFFAAGGLGGRVALWTTRRWLKVGVFRAHDAGPQGYLGVPALSWSAAQNKEIDPAGILPPQLATAGDDGVIKVWDVSGIFGGGDKAHAARLARQDFRKALRRLERSWPAEEWSLGGWRLRDKLQNLLDCEVDELSNIWANIRKQHGLPDDGLDDAGGEATLLAAIKDMWDRGIAPTSLMAEGREAFSVMVAARSNIPRPQIVVRFKAHASQALCVAWSPGGEILASGGADGMVFLWNVREPTAPPAELDPIDGESATNFLGARRWVTGVAFSPEGRRIVAVCGDRMAHLWSRKACKATESNAVAGGRWVRLGPPQRGHKAVIMAVSFAPDGTRFSTADGDGTVMRWHGFGLSRWCPKHFCLESCFCQQAFIPISKLFSKSPHL
jgi:WD40 repeat protein